MGIGGRRSLEGHKVTTFLLSLCVFSKYSPRCLRQHFKWLLCEVPFLGGSAFSLILQCRGHGMM